MLIWQVNIFFGEGEMSIGRFLPTFQSGCFLMIEF